MIPQTHARAGAFLAAKLRDVDAELAPTIPRVLASADDEAIHDMRVAIRRMRTVLKIARPLFTRFHSDVVRAGFTVVHRATGALRDEEVLEETLAAVDVADAAFFEWRQRRRARERALRRAVLVRLRSGELDRARELLGALVVLPVKPSREKDLAKYARRCVEDARRDVERLRDVPPTDVIGLHALRIAYKHLRYTAEVLGEALPIDLAAMAKPAAQLQKRLGDVHDVDVAIVSLGRARGLRPVVRGRVLAALGHVRTKKVTKYVDEMRGAPAPPKEPDAPEAPPSKERATPPAARRSGKSPRS